MERSEILEKAKQCVTGDREQDYGSPENNFKISRVLECIHRLRDKEQRCSCNVGVNENCQDKKR